MLEAITPIDGRYHAKTKVLSAYFSEYALIRYRVLVEIKYLVALAKVGILDLDKSQIDHLESINSNFSFQDAEKVKAIEKITNHDVKAVEYFLRERLSELGMEAFLEHIHFGLTSQDINNTAVPLSLKEAFFEAWMPHFEKIMAKLYALAVEWRDIPMLARTHGQPASPTLLGKELMVFVERLQVQIEMLKSIPFTAKFGGATGNYNAHQVSYPNTDWISFGNNFCQSLGLKRSQFTTQIEHYDMMAAHFQGMNRIYTILIDLSRDIWAYISMDYFKQKVVASEVGSSAMPHKVNPIDFENAEGNLGLAIAMGSFLAEKLPISRLQRDLTDSTVLRNIGLPYGYGLIALQSLEKGLGKLELNSAKIARDLDAQWAVLAEAIQTILRKERYPDPYNALKNLTRGKTNITQEDLRLFIDNLDLKEEVKTQLRQLRPETYTGVHPPF